MLSSFVPLVVTIEQRSSLIVLVSGYAKYAGRNLLQNLAIPRNIAQRNVMEWFWAKGKPEKGVSGGKAELHQKMKRFGRAENIKNGGARYLAVITGRARTAAFAVAD